MLEKMYTLRSLINQNGKNSLVDLQMEFEGKRAFAIWDSIPIGDYKLKARLELDPKLLKKVQNYGCDFFYHGELILPEPRNN
jgi:hypothetical protein